MRIPYIPIYYEHGTKPLTLAAADSTSAEVMTRIIPSLVLLAIGESEEQPAVHYYLLHDKYGSRSKPCVI